MAGQAKIFSDMTLPSLLKVKAPMSQNDDLIFTGFIRYVQYHRFESRVIPVTVVLTARSRDVTIDDACSVLNFFKK